MCVEAADRRCVCALANELHVASQKVLLHEVCAGPSNRPEPGKPYVPGPYDGGVWHGYVEFPDSYPAAPPIIRLLTPVRACCATALMQQALCGAEPVVVACLQIYHVNINSTGKVCHSVLGRNYASTMPIREVFDSIYALFLFPEPDDPLNACVVLVVCCVSCGTPRRTCLLASLALQNDGA